jgi:hypothetical protein
LGQELMAKVMAQDAAGAAAALPKQGANVN